MDNSLPTDLRNLQKLICFKNPEMVHFFKSPVECIKSWAQERQIQENSVVAVTFPYPDFFAHVAKELKITLIEIPRDPEKLVNLDLGQFHAVWLSNPNLCDGFFYPKDLYEVLINYFLSFPKIKILCEESTRFFFESKDNDLVGSIEKLLDNERLSLFSGTYAFSNETLSWIVQKTPLKNIAEIPSFEGEKQHRLFSLQSGKSMQYVYKQLLVQEYKLERFADKIRPLLQSRRVLITHWPYKLALNLVLDISPFLKLQKISFNEWWESLNESDKKFLMKLHGLKSQEQILLSLRGSYRESMALAERLNEIFLQSK